MMEVRRATELKEKLANTQLREENGIKKDEVKVDKSGENTLWKYINARKDAIGKALPRHMTPERMGMIAFNEIRKNPMLLKCSPQSLFGAILSASQLGLEPGPLGLCYLVPFYNNKTQSYDVQFILGYKGMLELTRRSGAVTNIYAHEVRENDEFSYSYGLNPELHHVPALKDRGKIIGFYAVAHLKDGGHCFEYMPVEEVEKRKERSKSKEYGPWVTDYEEMGKKTVLKHMWKFLPISVEIMKQAILDETVMDIEKPGEAKSVYELEADNMEDKNEPEGMPSGQ